MITGRFRDLAWEIRSSVPLLFPSQTARSISMVGRMDSSWLAGWWWKEGLGKGSVV